MQKSLYHTYRINITEKRKVPLPFELTFDEFADLIKQDCYICGSKPSNIRKNFGRPGVLIWNGIDRVDNTLGYISGNVMPCCSKCNSVKSDWDLARLKDHLKKMMKGLRSL